MSKDRLSPKEGADNVLVSSYPYQSLFDGIEFGGNWLTAFPMPYNGKEIPLEGPMLLKYTGTFLDVIEGLKQNVISETGDSLERILLAGRIVRGVLDEKIEAKSQTEEEIALVTAAVNLAIAIYTKNSDSLGRIADFEKIIVGAFGRDIYNKVIHQPPDGKTWNAMKPQYSEKAAMLLAEETEGFDIFFIPLGHGGAISGLDVFLRYRSLSSTKDSICYPVRFSKRKKHDMFPQLSEEEIKMLQEQSSLRPVVIFDEDVHTGDTLWSAKRTFERYLGIPITTLTNYGYSKDAEIDIEFDEDLIGRQYIGGISKKI